jgi:hypothetical protein
MTKKTLGASVKKMFTVEYILVKPGVTIKRNRGFYWEDVRYESLRALRTIMEKGFEPQLNAANLSINPDYCLRPIPTSIKSYKMWQRPERL